MLNRYRTIAFVFVLLIMGRTDAFAQNPGVWNNNAYHIMNAIRTRHSDLVMLAAHRGIHALWGSNDFTDTPENSLRSIQNAADWGIEIVELDVRLTQDGVPILSHDSTWGRNTDVGWGWGACSAKNGCFNPWGPLPGLTVPDGDPGELGGGADSPSDPQRAVNPNVSDWSLYSVQQAPAQRDNTIHGIQLRNSFNFQLSAWGENPPTLQNALDYIRSNKLPIVVALDIKDANAMKAAWKVVVANKDYNGNGYFQTTFFKFDAAWVYPYYYNFANDFNTHLAGGFYDDTYFINIMPVFQTSGIAPNLYRSEYNMRAAVQGYADLLATVGIEANLKQNPGILDTVTYWTYWNTSKALGNFNPYAEWIDPNDPNQTYQFFYSNGYCCAVPKNWFYNGAPNAQPSDTNDLRTQWPFLLDQGNGFNLITTDNVLPMAHYLWNEGKRNQSYLQ